MGSNLKLATDTTDGCAILSALRREAEAELRGNILPFWSTYPVNKTGGFYGALSNDLRVIEGTPRSSVLCARLLWTFSAAYRRCGDPTFFEVATHAYTALTETFWDHEHGGVYWNTDDSGAPQQAAKRTYAQAFAVYGLAEYARVADGTGTELAQRLFGLLEQFAYDPEHGGYLEGFDRAWEPLPDMRLGRSDPSYRKASNTLLHVLEAYTNLYNVWAGETLRTRLTELVDTLLTYVMRSHPAHLGISFDDTWRSLTPARSLGHDIEGSWLLVRAAAVLGDDALRSKTTEAALNLAEAVLRDGLSARGYIFDSISPSGVRDARVQWWPQAEAVVGFLNAYELSGTPRFLAAAETVWTFTQTHFVDKLHGDWFKALGEDGAPDLNHVKVGPWECPYHHSRMCLEVLARTEER